MLKRLNCCICSAMTSIHRFEIQMAMVRIMCQALEWEMDEGERQTALCKAQA